MTAGPLEVVVSLVATMRQLGVAVPVGSTVAFAIALAEVGADDRLRAYWAGRATLVHDPVDVAAFDAAFDAAFGAGAGTDPAAPDAEVEAVLLVDSDEVAADGLEAGPSLTVRWSAQEALLDKDFAACSPDELAEAQGLMADLRVAVPPKTARRRRPARRGELDLRATHRRALRTGGEPLRLAHRRRGPRSGRLVLLCDISGSMEPYARVLVRFGHVAVSGGARTEVFTLGTRCTRITRELRSHDADAALASASAAVEDWSGGTRLGEGLRSFNDGWGVRGLARGAVVVILSDGWDRGDAHLLGEQMARLGRVAQRIVWVNPLKAQPGFAPVAQGMAAALPHVDRLVEGHSLRSLAALAEVLAS